jgi:hypothetical protein
MSAMSAEMTAERVIKLFDELIAQGEEIKQACKSTYFAGNKRPISAEHFGEWKTSCQSLLKSTFGSSSPQYDNFVNAKFFDYYNSTQIYLGILKGARRDLEKGYFFHKDLMLSVNIFDALVARARRMLASGSPEKAEAVLEAVLLEVLAKICDNKKVPREDDESIGKIAEKLCKVDVISGPVRNRLLELQALFGNDAHGSRKKELAPAAEWILSFLDDYLGSQILILN